MSCWHVLVHHDLLPYLSPISIEFLPATTLELGLSRSIPIQLEFSLQNYDFEFRFGQMDYHQPLQGLSRAQLMHVQTKEFHPAKTI